jgi:hypothetical protein
MRLFQMRNSALFILLSRFIGCGLPSFSAFFLAAGTAATPPLEMIASPCVFEPNLGQAPAGVLFLNRCGGGVGLFRRPDFTIGSGEAQAPVRLVGANRAASVEGLDPVPSRFLYVESLRPLRVAPVSESYRRLRYRDVWPGIDILHRIAGGQFAFDFVVRPGSDARHVVLQMAGAAQLKIRPDGGLEWRAGSLGMRLQPPLTFQDDGGRKIVPSRYSLLGGDKVGIVVGPYDRGTELTIDPVLVWSARFGGQVQFPLPPDAVRHVALDRELPADQPDATPQLRPRVPRQVRSGRFQDPV